MSDSTTEVINPADGYPATPYTPAEWAGDEARQAVFGARAMDAAMRSNYSTNIYNIGRNIYPVLYVQSTFDGGRYTLVTDSQTAYVHQNVAPAYDVAKAVAHIPLGIFSIMSGYAQNAKNQQWYDALNDFQSSVMLTATYIGRLDYNFLGGDAYEACGEVISATTQYMTSLLNGSVVFTLENFSAMTHPLAGAIGTLQTIAANTQVACMKQMLEGWKAMIGDDAWNQMYVVISALWTLSVENAHEMIIKSMMDPDLQETHVIVSEAIETLDDALTLLGRIVGDRVMAECVFDPNGTETEKEDIYSLSTRRDLLSQAVEAALGEGGTATLVASCPHLAGR